ncbi:MAG: methyltransferase domain-containing protein [Lentisphaerae bacterium]|nr:methyltransferase domain-containing protein [Lentisphaerota bacterium]
MNKPFWEKTYANQSVSTFAKGPTGDVFDFFDSIQEKFTVLDVGCGEGRNAIYMASKGHTVDAFDLSEAGILKCKKMASEKSVQVNFWVQDLSEFVFEKNYNVILSHGVLHLPEKDIRDKFIEQAKLHTFSGGYNVIGIFTNRRPATPDNAPFTKSLFDVGELPGKYFDWNILHHMEGAFSDEHPGGIKHEHAYERIIARKP